MKPDRSVNGREFYSLVVEQTEDFALPFEQAPYPCLMWASKPTTPEFKAELARRLIESDCRYAVCGGTEHEEWEDAVDVEYVASDPDFDPPEERFVMTSSHEDGADDTAFFFVHCTNFDEHDFRRYLVLLVGGGAQVRDGLLNLIESHATPQRDVPDEAG